MDSLSLKELLRSSPYIVPSAFTTNVRQEEDKNVGQEKRAEVTLLEVLRSVNDESTSRASAIITNVQQNEDGAEVTSSTQHMREAGIIGVKQEEINSAFIKCEEINIKDEEDPESNFTTDSDEKQHKDSAVSAHVQDEHKNRQEEPKQQHNKTKRYKCDRCDFETIHKGSFQRHLLRHENPEEVKKFQCQFCNYKSFHKYNFEKHQRTHKTPQEIQATKRLECNNCYYITFHQSDLCKHQLTHKNADKAETLQCSHCEYQTFYNFRMKRHLLRHADPEDVKVFQCDFCNYKSVYKRNLNIHRHVHQRVHHVKMHNCDTCEYQTKYKHCMKKHLLRHKSNDNGEMDLNESSISKIH